MFPLSRGHPVTLQQFHDSGLSQSAFRPVNHPRQRGVVSCAGVRGVQRGLARGQHRGARAGAHQPVRGDQGGRGDAGQGVRAVLQAALRGDARQQRLRAPPVPGEAHPQVRAVGQSRAALARARHRLQPAQLPVRRIPPGFNRHVQRLGWRCEKS